MLSDVLACSVIFVVFACRVGIVEFRLKSSSVEYFSLCILREGCPLDGAVGI